MNRQEWSLIGGVALLFTVTFAIAYVDTVYFFNPVTFRRDAVTYLPYGSYKRPLTAVAMAYTESGLEVVGESSDLATLFGELKRGLALPSGGNPGRPSIAEFHTIVEVWAGPDGGGGTVLELRYWPGEGGGYLFTGLEPIWVPFTSALERWLQDLIP